MMYVVSTPERPDRRERLEGRLPAATWTADWPRPGGVTVEGMTPGEVGCALQHAAVWADIVANSAEQAVVLEDDADVWPGWEDAVAAYVAGLPAGWGMLYLGYVGGDRRLSGTRTSLSTVRFSGVVHQTHAYVLTLWGAQALVTADLPGHLRPICDFLAGVGLERYGTVPRLIYQAHPEDSQTQS
jgi:Glycosyltransferase family 25 (LPS biosynthesis protein)